MPAWIDRSARWLAGLEGIAVAIAVTYPLAGLMLTRPIGLGRLFVGILAIALTPIAVYAWANGQPRELASLLRRARVAWIAPVTLTGLFASGALAWSGWSQGAGVAVSLAALAVAAWSLAVWRHSGAWISGELRGGPDLTLETETATYVLERAPEGAVVGGWLTLPGVHVFATERGPYRSGRPTGRASAVLALPLSAIRRRALMHGLAYLTWSVVCAIATFAE